MTTQEVTIRINQFQFRSLRGAYLKQKAEDQDTSRV